jgi:hypothetical protein
MPFIVVVLTGCMGYVPGLKGAWDAKLEALCEQEGNVQILNQIIITPDEANLMRGSDGKFSIRNKSLAPLAWPVYSERQTTVLNLMRPRVTREEVTVYMRANHEPLAKWVRFARIGGDLPTSLGHNTSFNCPDPKELERRLQSIFIVRGE